MTNTIKNMTQLTKKRTYVYMNKTLIIEKLIKVCGQIDANNPNYDHEEPQYHFDLVTAQALRMLNNKQLNKLIEKQKSLL